MAAPTSITNGEQARTGDPEVALTSLASGAGCGCKLPAGALLGLLGSLPAQAPDEKVLVGSATSDDAGVYLIAPDLALVQTLDFFTAPVDDPFDFGRIAACNALSDIYAMGAVPLTALNIVAFPLERLGERVLGEILRGGLEVAARAGVQILGGHSIEDPEPKYGLAVSGVADPRRILSNAGARAGDVLALSKPLGTGAIVAARRHGVRDEGLLGQAVATMGTLNRSASEAAIAAGARALTDVTGFGLLGHLHHLCRESGVCAKLDAGRVPVIEGVGGLLEGDGVGVSGGARRNAAWAEGFASFAPEVPTWRRWLLADPTTSGGLLAALPAERAGEFPGVVIGRLLEGEPGTIRVA